MNFVTKVVTEQVLTGKSSACFSDTFPSSATHAGYVVGRGFAARVALLIEPA